MSDANSDATTHGSRIGVHPLGTAMFIVHEDPAVELLTGIHNMLAELLDRKAPTAGIHKPRIAGIHTAANSGAIEVTPEMIEAVAEFMFDTGVDTPMINALRSVAAALRNDIDDPVEVDHHPASRMQCPGRFSNPSVSHQ